MPSSANEAFDTEEIEVEPAQQPKSRKKTKKAKKKTILQEEEGRDVAQHAAGDLL